MRTTPLLATAWAGAATVAVGLGFFAVGLLDADPVPASAATPVTTAAATPSTAGPSTPGSAQTTAAAPLTGQEVTEGGTVYGSCIDGALQLGSAPAAGWEVDDSSTPTAVELKGGDRRIHVTATCGPTGPVFTVAQGGDDRTGDDRTGDDSGEDDDRPAVTPAPASTASSTSATGTASPTADDHGGSGGHGSDDSGSDDSSGRGSGGHGSDD